MFINKSDEQKKIMYKEEYSVTDEDGSTVGKHGLRNFRGSVEIKNVGAIRAKDITHEGTPG